MDRLLAGLQSFGIGRLAAIIGVSAGVAAALVALVLNVGTQPKALLYSNLDLKEAASISQALDQAGVKYEAKGDGSTIMVARDKVASTRLMLSSKGLPTSGSVGYEIFDNASALGQTDFVQNLNRQRALEGELARTIRSLDGVTFARVQLVLPKRQLFEEETQQPSASVVIGVAGREPSSDQVRALQNLVAGAVPDLKPERVTIVDQNSKMLGGGDGSAAAGQAASEAQNATEDAVRKRIKELVEGVVGPGHARVQVTADLDMSQVTTQEEKFDPDGQVVRSTQTTEEKSKQNEPDTAGQVGASANVPGTPGSNTTSTNASDSGRTEETTNYEISKTTKTTIDAPGQIKKLSIAVAVDGVTTPGAKGKPDAYAPRTAEEMQHIDQLVRTARRLRFDPWRPGQRHQCPLRPRRRRRRGDGDQQDARLRQERHHARRGAFGGGHRGGADHLLRRAPAAEHGRRRGGRADDGHARPARRRRARHERELRAADPRPADRRAPGHFRSGQRRRGRAAHRHRQDRRPGPRLGRQRRFGIRDEAPGGIGFDPPQLAA